MGNASAGGTRQPLQAARILPALEANSSGRASFVATLPSRRCDLEGGRFIRNDLESLSGRPARVVDVRFFGELSVDETAAGMEGSERSVRREGRKARAFLFAALRREGLG